jgi:hypothetical protein
MVQCFFELQQIFKKSSVKGYSKFLSCSCCVEVGICYFFGEALGISIVESFLFYAALIIKHLKTRIG